MNYGKVEILNKQSCHEGFFRLDEYRLRHALFKGGMSQPIKRELFERGHAVALLPYDPVRDELVLIEQFRIGALHDPQGPWLTEIVAGIIEADESAEQVARREALEEAGCEVQAVIPIMQYFVSPGGTSETIALFCGKVDTTKVAEGIFGLDEEHEDIRVLKVSFNEALTWLATGRINSAAPIIALQWLAMHKDEVKRQWRER